MATIKNPLNHGRASLDHEAWSESFDAFAQAEGDKPLDRDDLERLAWSAALRGCDEAFLGALERLHQACVEAQENKRAARAAFWIGFHLSSLGAASAAGWLTRAERLIENEKEPCAERGYLLLPEVHRHLGAANDIAAREVASEAARIGTRCGDHDLVALARNLEGRALLRQARMKSGLALLDEVMVAVTSGHLSPLATGIVYCNVITCCQQVFALDRAREWTAALARWCDQQPELVTFTGHCLVHRAEIMQLGGAWREALETIEHFCERRAGADPDAFGDACYQQGELLRLRGHFAEADQSYRLASENGHEPQPGFALLRLAQGQTDSAMSAMRRVLTTTTVKWQRARLLPAFIEILLAAGKLDDARAECRELDDIARHFGSEILDAMAAHARGAISLAEGDHRGAIDPLRHAFRIWHRMGAPYIAARIRVLLGRAFLGLGDREGAELERDAARKIFEALGAKPDLAALETSGGDAATTKPAHGLSRRELEVLRLLASGKTNKQIARELCVSERTVDRHVSNIFTKIGVGSRAAATAFAYQNSLF